MDEFVPGTPQKPRPVQSPASQASISQDATYPEQETVATVPVNYQRPATTTTTTQPTQLITHHPTTQPTQILENPVSHQRSSPTQQSSFVQVAGSSPLGPTTTGTNTTSSRIPMARPGGSLPNSIAPPGTQFRPLSRINPPVKRTPVMNSGDDDGPTYIGGSSDEGENFSGVSNIRPSTFAKAPRTTDQERVPDSPTPQDASMYKFKEITAAAFYNPTIPTNGSVKRQAGHPGLDRPPKRTRNDDRPQYASMKNHRDITSVEQIEDFQMRMKVKRMQAVFPHEPVHGLLDALAVTRGNYEDALSHVAQQEDKKQSSEDELSLDSKAPRAPAAKQQIKAKTRIQDRWTSSSQQLPNNSNNNNQAEKERDSRESSATNRRRLMRGPRPGASIEPTPAVKTEAPKRTGRLIRGRKNAAPPPRSESPEFAHADEDSDSEAESLPANNAFHDKVLEFFNSCEAEDLADTAEISIEHARTLISGRPFANLAAARKVTEDGDEDTKTTTTKKRRAPKRPLGDKIVDKCLDMWIGYEAVDSLVAQCESLGQPIATEMKRWGVDVFGARKGGELELVNLDKNALERSHDSGIGTPSSRRSDSDEEGDKVTDRSRSRGFIPQPAIMSESITMKDYQVVGLNWLNLLYDQKLSCILADDMGLGKTCQVISFLAHLLEKGVNGPHLVVVPASTLENWLREFSLFCPKLKTMPYYAGQAVRAQIRQEIEDNRDDINVVVTTYTIAKAKVDAAFLRSMDFNVCVYDEGHMLKSSKSLLYEKLIRIPAKFRLLLTGTPLQNNLQELTSLLGFILPSVFHEKKSDLEYIFSAKAKTAVDTHSSFLSARRIARAKSMLTPFVLRRKKHQVIDLPAKTARVEFCEMDERQKEIYREQIETVKQLNADRAAGKKRPGSKTSNILMKLRQAAIHPLFYRRLYTDTTLSRMSKACLKEEKWSQSDPDQIFSELCAYNDFECHTLCTSNPKSLGRFALKNDEWMNSGKIDRLSKILKGFTENGDRALVFSQFTMVMDILEQVLETLNIKFFRLDGTTSVEDRQTTLDAFYEQVEIPVFLLSTKAAGAGINLACANKVVIFDSSFNPQEDIQAENRAHRVGQTREVEVVRIVTKDTIEEQMYALGQTKLALDQKVAGEDEDGSGRKSEEAGMKVVESLLLTEMKDKGDEKV